MRMIDYFDRGAQIQPRRVCVRDGSQCLSYDEVRTASHQIARRLRLAGFAREERAAIYSPNAALGFVALMGIFRAAGVWLPVNTRNAVEENQRYLRENHCAVLFFHSSLAAEAEAMRAGCEGIRLLVCIDGHAPGSQSLADWLTDTDPAPIDAGGSEDDLVIIKSTGGTTGRPKSVMHTHRNMGAMIGNLLASVHYAEPPVYLMAIPMTHGAGTIALALMTLGATLIVHERADPQRILDSFEREGVTTTFLTPTVVYALLARPDAKQRRYPALRDVIYGGAPIAAARLVEAIEVFGPVMTTLYGQVEALLICTFMSAREHIGDDGRADPARLRSCGRRTPFTRVEIMDDDGKLLGAHEVGEIVVRGGNVMKGYYGNPEETAKVSQFGWHHTGDVGMRDDDGYFYIVDRKKDMIISGGFNIYPSEVEQALWKHPAVQECAVIGVPDEKWGEAVKAVVQLKSGSIATVDELMAHCRGLLAGMKNPKSLEIWPELPRSEVGKVLKREIRDRFWEGRERAI